MAEGILYDLVGNLLWQLGSLVFEEIKLARGFKDEVGKLKETVKAIQAVLRDAEEQHSKKNHQVTLWLQRLKDAVYDADDLLDDFLTELKQRKVMSSNKIAKEVRIFFSKSNLLEYSLKMAHKVKTIRERLDAIKNDRQFHLDEKLVENIQREQTHSFVRAEEVIGRDDDKKAIIQLLLESNDDIENVSVISIVGIGGLGKTTVAQVVYNDDKVTNYFQLKMWVCVSDDFNVETIVENITKSISNKVKVEELNANQLQESLRKEITGKRYLLVLDDIWNENRDKWLKLKTLLMNDMRGSKILVTTRSDQVAKVTSNHSPYVLRGLSENESWSLFTQMAFENGAEPQSSNLVRIGKCILAKCVGVPLAIRTIGRLIYYNNTETYWLHFIENELSQISQEDSDILPKLKLSYDYLPSHLKQCFAYCALLPKDYVIKKESLINLWMAQGLLESSNRNRCPEDVGNEHFMNLVSRSFLQDVKYDKWNYVTTCKMHDLMHDLATFVTGGECSIATLDATNVQERVHHVSFDSGLDKSWEIPNALLRTNHIRTHLLPDQSNVAGFLRMSNIEKILSNFRFLRTLQLSKSLNFLVSIESINKLKHLRYLNLSQNYSLHELPNSITRLKNLQTLVLDECVSLRKLPRKMRKMVSLRCLSMNGCVRLARMPCGLGLLTSLRTLSMFVLDWRNIEAAAELDELGEMNNLSGKLEIRGLEYAKSKSTLANLKAKQHLECLVVNFSQDDLDRPICYDVPTREEPLEGL